MRNVTGTLRSIVTGLCYLATGLFGANAVGLTGLGLQTLSQGGAGDRENLPPPPPPPSSAE